MSQNPTFTLAMIRHHGPSHHGWEKALARLGPDLDAALSLGDVARSNGAADALWCIRVLDWSDVAVRRAVIAGAVMPCVRRALRHTRDQRAHGCVAAVERWCAGDDAIDLRAAADAACAAAYAAAYAAHAVYAAANAAYAAAYAAAEAAAKAAVMADIIAAFPPIRSAA